MSNKINLNFLNNYQIEEKYDEKIIICSQKNIDNFMSFIVADTNCVQFDYLGFKIIKTNNSNISIRNLIYKDN
ncbi:MAG: hypothetical protein K2H80_00935, partial [Ureaplasma sp.]|nr:hypothetical protein [Ureaplasma sp.]